MMKSPDYISALRPYVPGKPVEELERELGIKGPVKIASNENPLGPSPKALSMMKNTDFHLNRYPDGGGFYLKRRLSEIYGFSGDSFVLGNGSNELLNLAAVAYLSDRNSAVMAAPSFVVYHSATRMAGATAIQVPLTRYRHDLKAMAQAITADTKIVFIANPNNPTGTMNTAKEFAEFMESVPDGVLVVVDEAYVEYVSDKNYPDSLRYLRDGRDILVLRTFSKIYGLAGLRIGYGISKKGIISELDKVRPPFNTSTIAQMAAIAALDDREHIEKSIRVNEAGKSFLYRELDTLHLDFVPTEANFIYIVLGRASADQVFNDLLRKGVIVRPMGDRAIRVTIGLPEENKRFIDAIREVAA